MNILRRIGLRGAGHWAGRLAGSLRGALLATALVVGSVSSASAAYWNVFNIEGESSASAAIVTYATLSDMLIDANRTGVSFPDTPGFGRNVVGSGSDGSTYWNVFNIEGESSASAATVTYATLSDMLTDTNRTGVSFPNTPGFGSNVVGSGASVARPSIVPEPASLAVLGPGVLVLALVRRRWRRTA